MLLIPTIEIRAGRVVGSDADPVALVARLVALGLRRIQLVDLDAAAGNGAHNNAVFARAISAGAGADLQVAGGVGDEDGVQRHLDAGAQFVVLDTKVATHGHTLQDLCLEFPNHVLVSLEAAGGRPAADHWSKFAQHSAVEVARQFEREGVAAVIHLDRNAGWQRGPSVAATVALACELQVPVIAAGGVSRASEIVALAAAEPDGVIGALLDPACLQEGFALESLLCAVD